MNCAIIEQAHIRELLISGRPLIDVRAPCEFAQGSLPGSVNLPILEDAERALVGTTYKQEGQAAAIQLGHKLVSGEVKEARVKAWRDFVAAHPDAVILCFRGGLRSRTAQTWLAEAGCPVPRLQGGYKYARQTYLQVIIDFAGKGRLLVISGPTGSGKTLLLRAMAQVRPILDLEEAAHHRGSAFGGYGGRQPSQVDFENHIARQILKLESMSFDGAVLIEDESRLVGTCVVPDSLFALLRNSAVLVVEEDLQSRVQTTFVEYVLGSELIAEDQIKALAVFERYQASLKRIARKLGGLRTQQAQRLMDWAWQEQLSGRGVEAHRQWIEFLLREYYDPMYLGSLDKRAPAVLFRGTREAAAEFLLAGI